jgi:hypothetical protein
MFLVYVIMQCIPLIFSSLYLGLYLTTNCSSSNLALNNIFSFLSFSLSISSCIALSWLRLLPGSPKHITTSSTFALSNISTGIG